MRQLVEGVDLKGTFGCAAFSLRKTARVVTQLYDDALRGAGVRSTQYAILVAIAKDQPATIGDVAERTLTDPTTMTRNLRLLKAEGLVEIAARGAKRAKLVRLSKKGERVLVKATPAWRAMQTRFVGRFGERKWEEMRRELETLAAIATGPR